MKQIKIDYEFLNQAIEFLKKDTRYCKSPNLQKFFRKHSYHYASVVRTPDGRLNFAIISEDGTFAGCTVIHAACFGSKAFVGWKCGQKPNAWKDETEWFWNTYKEEGIVGLPEIWNIKKVAQKKHRELHTV